MQGRRKEPKRALKETPGFPKRLQCEFILRTCRLHFGQCFGPELCLRTNEPRFPSFTMDSRFKPFFQHFRWIGRPTFTEILLPLHDICAPRLSKRAQRSPKTSQRRSGPSIRSAKGGSRRRKVAEWLTKEPKRSCKGPPIGSVLTSF